MGSCRYSGGGWRLQWGLGRGCVNSSPVSGGWSVPSAKMDSGREIDGLHIDDLPDHLLVEVASFLDKECRALWAVSMSAPSGHWTTSSAVSVKGGQILTLQRENWREEWREFDFGAFHRVSRLELYDGLSDDDLKAVLICIDAVTNVESLYLKRTNRPTVSSRITGRGLEPLRGSTALKRVDISLVGGYCSDTDGECRLELGEVLPVLDSIVESNGNKLCHIQLPNKWRDAKHDSLSRFIARYNDMLETRVYKCCQCDASACESECFFATNCAHRLSNCLSARHS